MQSETGLAFFLREGGICFLVYSQEGCVLDCVRLLEIVNRLLCVFLLPWILLGCLLCVMKKASRAIGWLLFKFNWSMKNQEEYNLLHDEKEDRHLAYLGTRVSIGVQMMTDVINDGITYNTMIYISGLGVMNYICNCCICVMIIYLMSFWFIWMWLLRTK